MGNSIRDSFLIFTDLKKIFSKLKEMFSEEDIEYIEFDLGKVDDKTSGEVLEIAI